MQICVLSKVLNILTTYFYYYGSVLYMLYFSAKSTGSLYVYGDDKNVFGFFRDFHLFQHDMEAYFASGQLLPPPRDASSAGKHSCFTQETRLKSHRRRLKWICNDHNNLILQHCLPKECVLPTFNKPGFLEKENHCTFAFQTLVFGYRKV